MLEIIKKRDYGNILNKYKELRVKGNIRGMEIALHDMARINIDNTEILDLVYKTPFKKYFVYKLISKGEVVYVGQSMKPIKRLYVHTKDKVFDEVKICQCVDKSSALNFEALEINKYQPLYNKVNKLVRDEIITGVLEYKDLVEYLNDQVLFDQGEYHSIFKFNIRCASHMVREIQCSSSKNGNWHGYNNIFIRKDLSDGCFTYGDDENFITNYKEREEDDFDFSEIHHLRISEGIYQIADIVFTKNGKWRYSWESNWKKRSAHSSYEIGIKRAKQQENSAREKIVWFGKHKGKSLSEIQTNHPDYIKWMKKNLDKVSLQKLGLWEEPKIEELTEAQKEMEEISKIRKQRIKEFKNKYK